MFLLNPGRYVIADPDIILKADTFKKLWSASVHFNSYVLATENGNIYAMPAGKKGTLTTDMGKTITTTTGYVAIAPYLTVEKLLPYEALRITLVTASLLFFNEKNYIILDGKLTIFCNMP